MSTRNSPPSVPSSRASFLPTTPPPLSMSIGEGERRNDDDGDGDDNGEWVDGRDSLTFFIISLSSLSSSHSARQASSTFSLSLCPCTASPALTHPASKKKKHPATGSNSARGLYLFTQAPTKHTHPRTKTPKKLLSLSLLLSIVRSRREASVRPFLDHLHDKTIGNASSI